MMPVEVRDYLEQVRKYLRLDPEIERQVASELYTHFEESIAELQARGFSENYAAKSAIDSFGRPRVVARLMYEAYGKGSCKDACIAAMPHLIMALLFASHFWNNTVIAPAAFITIVGVTLFGWWNGKPNWLYSWIGYSLVPLLIAGYTSRQFILGAIFYLQSGGSLFPSLGILLVSGALLVFFGWVVIRTSIRVVKRDWLLASLMLVPLPILGTWLFNIEQVGGLFQSPTTILHYWDSTMALAFIVLSITTAGFIRLRKRVLKIGAVITVGSIALVMVVHNLWGSLGFFALLAIFLLMLVFLFAPALLEARLGHGDRETWSTFSPEQSTIVK